MTEQKIDGSAAGSALAAMRKVKTLHCAVCQKEIEGRGRKTYCSPACIGKAYRNRKAQATT
jgi:hypothetical protein